MDKREMVSVEEAREILDASPDLGAAVETGCGVLDNALTGGRQPFDFMAHPLTMDPRHEPGCICHAIARGSCSECDRGDAIMAALAALPLDAPGGGS